MPSRWAAQAETSSSTWPASLWASRATVSGCEAIGGKVGRSGMSKSRGISVARASRMSTSGRSWSPPDRSVFSQHLLESDTGQPLRRLVGDGRRHDDVARPRSGDPIAPALSILPGRPAVGLRETRGRGPPCGKTAPLAAAAPRGGPRRRNGGSRGYASSAGSPCSTLHQPAGRHADGEQTRQQAQGGPGGARPAFHANGAPHWRIYSPETGPRRGRRAGGNRRA